MEFCAICRSNKPAAEFIAYRICRVCWLAFLNRYISENPNVEGVSFENGIHRPDFKFFVSTPPLAWKD